MGLHRTLVSDWLARERLSWMSRLVVRVVRRRDAAGSRLALWSGSRSRACRTTRRSSRAAAVSSDDAHLVRREFKAQRCVATVLACRTGEVCSERFGSIERAVANGLALRYDGGPASAVNRSSDHLGIARSGLRLRSPKRTVAPRSSFRQLKKQVLWIERLPSSRSCAAVRRLAANHNYEWLLERHDYRTPTEAREHLPALRPAAMTQSLGHRRVRGASGRPAVNETGST